MKVFKPLAEGTLMSQGSPSSIPSLPNGAVLRLAHSSGFRYRFGDSSVIINQGSQGILVPASASGGGVEIFLHPEDGSTHVAVSANDVNLSYGYLL